MHYGLRVSCILQRIVPGARPQSRLLTMICRKISHMANPHRIKTAACMIIGDEVLNSKIRDTNSLFFSRFCYELGIDLRRIVVVPDEKHDIVSTLNYLKQYDFIVTTGGIGPTHDDITYESISDAYGLPMKLHQETVDKMNKYARNKPSQRSGDVLEAQLRMAKFPDGPGVRHTFAMPASWVPIVSLEHKVYIFPGIPSLFQKMLEGIRTEISNRVDCEPQTRYFVSTAVVESEMAPVLSEIHQRYESARIKIGSYPHFYLNRNTVSILGPQCEKDTLRSIVAEVTERLDGKEVSAEEEARAF